MHYVPWISGVTFSPEISIGNILTLATILFAGSWFFFDLKARSRTNRTQIELLTKRIDLAELEKMKVCVDTMWLFQLRRGIVELEEKGLGAFKSPLRLTEEAKKLMEPLIPDLRKLYREIDGDNLGIVELAVVLEARFGSRLASEVCKKVGVNDAACLVLAIGMLRPVGPDTLHEAKSRCVSRVNEAVAIMGSAPKFMTKIVE